MNIIFTWISDLIHINDTTEVVKLDFIDTFSASVVHGVDLIKFQACGFADLNCS